MVKGKTVRRLKMKASKRALKLLADQAIGNDLLKGFLELITNSDESYARLESKAQQCSGTIEVEVDRRPRKKQTILRVLDWAEGMDETQLEKCVGSYGEDTSGQVGRGVFGMGLKDTINAFGEGSITSFKNGFKYLCRLKNVEDIELEEPSDITKHDREGFRNSSGGTSVEIVVQNPKVRIPLIDSLRQQLQTHVCLRGIMMDAGRKVILRDLRGGSADELRYQLPESELILDAAPLTLPSFPNVVPRLTVRRAVGSDSLSQSTSYRTGGIVITSKRTFHEATLFGFDEDPHAAKLFGELRCDEIYDLQANGEQIVDKNRSGLRRDHILTRELVDAAKKIIESIVSTERTREKQREQALERAETVRRFKEAVRSLNEIANKELQIGGAGPGKGNGVPSTMRPPQDGMEFIPDTYRILVAERESLKLRVQVDGSTGIAVGDRIEISCDNPHIRLLDNTPVVSKLFHEDPPLSHVHVHVEGLQANAQGFVTARFGNKSAIAAVEVVSTKTQKDRPPTSGLFKEIRYEEQKDLPLRARFDRKEGFIWINTLGPSVSLYFGPGGEGQEEPPNQVLVAELVTELACQEIARVKRETKTLDIPPGVDELDAFYTHINRLKGDYAPVIHRALVNSENRRR
jgi:hypothetical protein